MKKEIRITIAEQLVEQIFTEYNLNESECTFILKQESLDDLCAKADYGLYPLVIRIMPAKEEWE